MSGTSVEINHTTQSIYSAIVVCFSDRIAKTALSLYYYYCVYIIIYYRRNDVCTLVLEACFVVYYLSIILLFIWAVCVNTVQYIVTFASVMPIYI